MFEVFTAYFSETDSTGHAMPSGCVVKKIENIIYIIR